MPRHTLSEFDKKLRKEISYNLKMYTQGLTQAELSLMTGIPTSTLSGYFAERSTISDENVQKIADTLGLDKRDIDPRFEETPSSDLNDTVKKLDRQIFAKNLKYLRTKSGRTQNELAEILQTTRANITSWEIAKSAPKLFSVYKSIVELFNVSIDDLFFTDLMEDGEDKQVNFNIEIGKKLFNARKNKGMSRAYLGKLVNLHESTVKRYEDGQIKTLDIEKMKEFAKVLDINPEFLMGFEGEVVETETNSSYLTVYRKVYACDEFEVFEDPLDEIINPYPKAKGEFFALQVQGDSMNKVVDDGLYAIIKKEPIVNNGEIAIVLIDHQLGMLKRFYRVDDMVILRPDSTNPDHKPLTFVGEQINEIKILGKFVGFVSPLMD